MKLIEPNDLESIFNTQEIYLYHINDESKEALEAFITSHPPYDNTLDEELSHTHAFGFPVVRIAMPVSPTQSRFYDSFLDHITREWLPLGQTQKKQHLMRYYLKNINAEVLVVDNIERIFKEPTMIRLNLLESIELIRIKVGIPVVLCSENKDILDYLIQEEERHL